MENTLIQERYNNLNKDYQDFVTSDFASQSAMVLGRKVGLTGNKVTILENGIVLYLLLILNFEEMISFIAKECELSSEEASEISYVVLDSLPANFSAMHDTAFATLNTESVEATDKSAPATAPAAAPLTTPPNDVYSTTQEAILNERPTNE